MKKAKIILTEDGSHSLINTDFDISYHSIHGAIQESQHVFIDAAFRMKAVLQNKLDILEIGFGTGLNAYLSYLEAKKRKISIQYTTVEAYPISLKKATKLNYPKLLQQKQAKFLQLHQVEWNKVEKINALFSLEKLQQDALKIDFSNRFDIIYFDAFAPDAQPELWEPESLQKMYTALKQDGFFVTYCAKGIVKRRLKAVGFFVESIKGPPGKREMTRAIKL